jgi:hypothetical protein
MCPGVPENLGEFFWQFRALRLGFFQDGDVGVGVLPRGEEVREGELISDPEDRGRRDRSVAHKRLSKGPWKKNRRYRRRIPAEN